MSFEKIAAESMDFLGDVQEQLVDIATISTDFFNPEGMEALMNGDIYEAFEKSDIGPEGAANIKEVVNRFDNNDDNSNNKNGSMGERIMIRGASGLILTMASPEPATTAMFATIMGTGALLAKFGI